MATAPLLQTFIEDELARSSALIEQVRVATLERLREGAPETEARARNHQHEVAQTLQRHASRYGDGFVAVLRTLVQAELAAHGLPAHSAAAPATSGLGLSLMDETQVESDIEVSRATLLIDSMVEWEQRELQTFTSALSGHTHVVTESNPLRPAIIARALWLAACELPLLPVQCQLLLRASAHAMGAKLKLAYAAACTRLEALGVTPSAYRSTTLVPGAAARREDTPAAASTVDVTQPGALEGLLARMPGSQDAPGKPPRVEQQTVELLSRLFDAMLADPLLPSATKDVLARLQGSAQRVALHDPSLIDAHDHSTWGLIERIASASRQTAVAAPERLAALTEFCQALAAEVAQHPAPDAALYARTLARLNAFVADGLQAARKAAHGAIDSLRRTEGRMQLQAFVQARLEEQLLTTSVSDTLRRFLLGPWSQLLAESILQSGESGEPTLRYTQTVDDLLWSLNPPAHPASRQRLVKLLPGLLAQLHEGMARVGVSQPAQQALLDELMAAHTEALRPGATQEKPEDIVRRLRDESAQDAPATTAFGDSVVDLGTLDTVPADLLPADGARAPTSDSADQARRIRRWVDALAPGDALRLLLQGRWIGAQLLWRSQGGDLLLFASRGGMTHALTRRALERLHAEGLATQDEAGSLMQRAVDSVMATLDNPARTG